MDKKYKQLVIEMFSKRIRAKLEVLALVIALLSPLLSPAFQAYLVSIPEEGIFRRENSNSLETRIIIHRNLDFKKYANSGNGTISNPFTIENITITGSSGSLISISGTTDYFIIQNSNFNGLDSNDNGIFLNNVLNGIIFNNTFVDNNNGINLWNVENVTISNNEVIRGVEAIGIGGSSKFNIIDSNLLAGNLKGINLHPGTSYNNLTGNSIFNNWAGIDIQVESRSNYIFNNSIGRNNNGFPLAGDDNIIVQNYFSENINGALFFYDNSARNNLIVNNTMDNNEYGLGIGGIETMAIGNIMFDHNNGGVRIFGGSVNVIFQDNMIYDNQGIGIDVQNTTSTVIESNLVFRNSGYALFVDYQSLNVTVQFNDFKENNGQNLSQGLVDTTFIKFTQNYWDDWNESSVYTFDGEANITENNPSIQANHMILESINLEINQGTPETINVLIWWSPVNDPYHEVFEYSIYFLGDDNTTWLLMVMGVADNQYLFENFNLLDYKFETVMIIATDEIGFFCIIIYNVNS